jgi:serine/threonine protein phosphatase 1
VVYAIGDVHGCSVELGGLIELIIADAEAYEGEKWLVLLGDYIDRGPDSASVLDWLCAPPPAGLRRIALAGNHDVMMLDYEADPRRNGLWLEHGGVQALLSYGLDAAKLDGRSSRDIRRLLATHIPTDHFALLRSLPLTLSLPGIVFVHAGIRPGVAIREQSETDLLWTPFADERPALPDQPAVVHGHIPALEPLVTPASICVDTGAFATGKLTAVRLTSDGSYHFIQTSGQALTFVESRS